MICNHRGRLLATSHGDQHECIAQPGSRCVETQAQLDEISKFAVVPYVTCEGCPLFKAVSVPEPATITKGNFCYFSCDTTPRGSDILTTMVASARASGVLEDFHVFCGKPVDGAIHHKPGPIDIKHHIFKWKLLRDHLAKLDYDYFVWLDSDTIFTRHPGDLKNLLRDNAMWCQLESESTSPNVKQGDWWGATIPQYNQMLTDHGITGEKRYNTNGGMWIVRKEAIETFVREALKFHSMCLAKGLSTTSDEPPLAWLGQLEEMSGYGPWVKDKHLNTNPATCETWSCDWMGRFSGRIPDGSAWECEDWLTGEKRPCNPAIVHAMRSKDAMAAAAITESDWPIGDHVESALSSVGITKERVSRWLGAPCNCPARQAKLNKLGHWAAGFAKGLLGRSEAEKMLAYSSIGKNGSPRLRLPRGRPFA